MEDLTLKHVSGVLKKAEKEINKAFNNYRNTRETNMNSHFKKKPYEK